MTQGLRQVARHGCRHRNASEHRGRQGCQDDAGHQKRGELAAMRWRKNTQQEQGGAEQQT